MTKKDGFALPDATTEVASAWFGEDDLAVHVFAGPHACNAVDEWFGIALAGVKDKRDAGLVTVCVHLYVMMGRLFI